MRLPILQIFLFGLNFSYPCITAVPPPNIIQHQPPPIQSIQAQPQNVIFQTTNATGAIPLQQLQFHPPPSIVDQRLEAQTNIITTNGTDIDGNTHSKDDKSSPEPSELTKADDKTESDNHESNENVPTNRPSISMQMPPPIRYASTPIMAVPPPISCVQHIVGNTIITSSQPAGTQTHQIYNPVSIQSIQAAPPGQQQQIHLSSSGQHFVVNTQYPQQTFQQVPQNVQSFQLTAAPQSR